MGSGLPLTEWMAAESAGRTFTVAGGWGTATGVVASPPERAGWFARGRGDSARAPVVLLAPQWPGLEDALELAISAWNVGALLSGEGTREHPKGQPVGGWLMGSASYRF